MLRLLVNLLILFFLIRLLRPVFQKAGRLFRGAGGENRVDEGATKSAPSADNKKEYDELTPYEIEDADFEEIRRDGQ